MFFFSFPSAKSLPVSLFVSFCVCSSLPVSLSLHLSSHSVPSVSTPIPTHHTPTHTRPQHSGDQWIECREVASGRTLFYHATSLQIAFDAKPGAGGVLTRTFDLSIYLSYSISIVFLHGSACLSRSVFSVSDSFVTFLSFSRSLYIFVLLSPVLFRFSLSFSLPSYPHSHSHPLQSRALPLPRWPLCPRSTSATSKRSKRRSALATNCSTLPAPDGTLRTVRSHNLLCVCVCVCVCVLLVSAYLSSQPSLSVCFIFFISFTLVLFNPSRLSHILLFHSTSRPLSFSPLLIHPVSYHSFFHATSSLSLSLPPPSERCEYFRTAASRVPHAQFQPAPEAIVCPRFFSTAPIPVNPSGTFSVVCDFRDFLLIFWSIHSLKAL